MAIPTLVSLSPNSGPVRGGDKIVLTGTNFRTAPLNAPTGYTSSAEQQTIAVKFDGVLAPYAAAASATVAHVVVPQWLGSYKLAFPVAVDVRLANLNDAGAEIATENVTKVDAYSYTRPSFSTECYFQRVIREMVKMMRRNLSTNVHLTIDKNYTDDPTDHERLRAVAPVYHVVGPRVVESFIDTQRKLEVQDTTYPAFIEKKPPIWSDLEWDVNIYAENPTALFSMCQAFMRLFRSGIKVRVPNEAALPAGLYKDYQCYMDSGGIPQPDLAPDVLGLLNAQGSFSVRGVQIDDEAGTVIDRGSRITSNDGDPEIELEAL
jgi:hypothetical protein